MCVWEGGGEEKEEMGAMFLCMRQCHLPAQGASSLFICRNI